MKLKMLKMKAPIKGFVEVNKRMRLMSRVIPRAIKRDFILSENKTFGFRITRKNR